MTPRAARGGISHGDIDAGRNSSRRQRHAPSAKVGLAQKLRQSAPGSVEASMWTTALAFRRLAAAMARPASGLPPEQHLHGEGLSRRQTVGIGQRDDLDLLAHGPSHVILQRGAELEDRLETARVALSARRVLDGGRDQRRSTISEIVSWVVSDQRRLYSISVPRS